MNIATKIRIFLLRISKDFLQGGNDLASLGLHNTEFSLIFWDIFKKSVPFLLLGAAISALLEAYLPADRLTRLLPRKAFPGIIAAGLMGIVFPICECGIVLVVRRLVKKGLPLYLGTVFMLAAPIVNPVVYASTKIAFADYPHILFLRIFGGFVVAVTIGLLLKLQCWDSGESIRPDNRHSAGCCSSHTMRGPAKIKAVVTHATAEFFSIGKYFMLGAMIAAYLQSVIPASTLNDIGLKPGTSTFLMMGMSYLLSLCSEADAFVASTFFPTFTTGSVLTFLIYGPMIDFKNTFILLGAFTVKYVAVLIFSITALVYTYSFIVNMLF